MIKGILSLFTVALFMTTAVVPAQAQLITIGTADIAGVGTGYNLIL